MDWQPIELTEADKSWIEEQKYMQDRILNAFALVSPKPKPVQEYTDIQKKAIRGMEVIGQVAKLYKKRGQPPVWVSIASETSRIARSRDKPRMRQSVQPTLYGCGTCKLPFIGKVRCQCKPEVKIKKAIAEYIENRINDEVLVSPLRSIPEVV